MWISIRLFREEQINSLFLNPMEWYGNQRVTVEHHQETFHQLEQIQVQNKLPQHSRQLHYISAEEIKAFKYDYIQPKNSDPS